MKAMIVENEVLVEKTADKPVVQDGEILVKIKATAVNRTDVINRKSKSAYLDFPILGVEVAGVVVEVGNGATVEAGTRVMGLVNGGAYAEYVTMPADRAMVIPKNLSFEEAAAIPEVFLTAYQTLFWHGRLSEKETVLIHAGGSGVGTAAIQLARHISDANIIVTAGSDEKLEVCNSLGANTAINYKKEDFSGVIQDVTAGKGVDVILDFIGASYWEKNYKSMGVDGRWVLIGALGGDQIKELSLMKLMSKRITLIGTLLTPRTDQYKADLSNEFITKTKALFESGKMKPIIDRKYPLNQVQEAHEYMEADKNVGKLVLSVEA